LSFKKPFFWAGGGVGGFFKFTMKNMWVTPIFSDQKQEEIDKYNKYTSADLKSFDFTLNYLLSM